MAVFSHVIFYVDNVLKSVDFYEKVFGFQVKFIHESNQYVEIDTGAVVLAFASNILGLSNLPNGFIKSDLQNKPLGSEIVFTVEDVQLSFDKAIEAGACQVAVPTKKPWGQIVAYVRDTNGVLIEIASVMVADVYL